MEESADMGKILDLDKEEYGGSERTKILPQNQLIRKLPKICISFYAFQKIRCFTDLMDYEIHGLGIVEEFKAENKITVVDAFLTKQKVSFVNAETTRRDMGYFLAEFTTSGGDTSKLKFQWHSHADMDAFFSSEDIDTISGYVSDYMISLVINKKGEYKCRLDIFKPVYIGIEVPLYVIMPKFSSVVSECGSEIKKHVSINFVDKILDKFPGGVSYVKDNIELKVEAEEILFEK